MFISLPFPARWLYCPGVEKRKNRFYSDPVTWSLIYVHYTIYTIYYMYICNIYWAHIEFLRGKGKCRHFYWLFCVCAPRTISNYLNPNTYWFWIIFRPTTPFLCFCEIYKKKNTGKSPPAHKRANENDDICLFLFKDFYSMTEPSASRCFTWRTSIQNTSLHVLDSYCTAVFRDPLQSHLATFFWRS